MRVGARIEGQSKLRSLTARGQGFKRLALVEGVAGSLFCWTVGRAGAERQTSDRAVLIDDGADSDMVFAVGDKPVILYAGAKTPEVTIEGSRHIDVLRFFYRGEILDLRRGFLCLGAFGTGLRALRKTGYKGE